MVSRGTDRKRPTRDLFSRFSNIFRDLPPTAHADSLVPRRPPLPKVPAARPPHPPPAPLRVNPHPSESASELHAAVTLLLPYFDSLQLSYSETATRGQNSVNPKTEPPTLARILVRLPKLRSSVSTEVQHLGVHLCLKGG